MRETCQSVPDRLTAPWESRRSPPEPILSRSYSPRRVRGALSSRIASILTATPAFLRFPPLRRAERFCKVLHARERAAPHCRATGPRAAHPLKGHARVSPTRRAALGGELPLANAAVRRARGCHAPSRRGARAGRRRSRASACSSSRGVEKEDAVLAEEDVLGRRGPADEGADDRRRHARAGSQQACGGREREGSLAAKGGEEGRRGAGRVMVRSGQGRTLTRGRCARPVLPRAVGTGLRVAGGACAPVEVDLRTRDVPPLVYGGKSATLNTMPPSDRRCGQRVSTCTIVRRCSHGDARAKRGQRSRWDDAPAEAR